MSIVDPSGDRRLPADPDFPGFSGLALQGLRSDPRRFSEVDTKRRSDTRLAQRSKRAKAKREASFTTAEKEARETGRRIARRGGAQSTILTQGLLGGAGAKRNLGGTL